MKYRIFLSRIYLAFSYDWSAASVPSLRVPFEFVLS
jgi:hypothetical protein